MTEIDMPPPRYAQVNGIRLAYYEAGPRDGVPIVLSHGFPELAFSWRHQIKALAEAGRWVIAPDQRGYGLSDRPAAVEAYDIHHLCGDLAGLLDHLGAERAVWCGHDWGGIVAWHMPLLHPDRTAGVIGLNTPFQPRAPIDPIQILTRRFGPQMYIVWFQTPDTPEAALSADIDRTIRFFMRRPKALFRDEPAPPAGRSRFDFARGLAAFDPSADQAQFLTEAERAVFVRAFARSGFTGPINWYRNLTRNWTLTEGLTYRIDAHPCLMITAELDAVLTPAMAAPMPGLIADLEMHQVAGSGHWTQQEKPDEVSALIRDWLDRRFPT